jgi:hypothetical protein
MYQRTSWPMAACFGVGPHSGQGVDRDILPTRRRSRSGKLEHRDCRAGRARSSGYDR